MDFLIVSLTALLDGAVTTVGVTIAALALGLVLGLSLALGRTYGSSVARLPIALYVTIIRALPPVLTLFILFFVITRIVDLSPLQAGILALGIASSAYQSEIFRGSLQSVGDSQMIAARAIGMNRRTAVQHIVLPQAFRLAIPPWSNEVALVVKNSALVYALGVPEMMRQAQYIASRTHQALLIYSITAIVYLVMVFIANRGLDLLERRVSLPTQVESR